MTINIKNIMHRCQQTILVGGLLALMPFFAASCSEDDGVEEEFVDWQTTNEEYFESQYQKHATKTDDAFVVRKWSAPEEGNIPHTDCIIVDVVEHGTGTTSPYYGDSICMQYRGRLLPSKTYAEGYVFDQSFEGDFDADVLAPYKMPVYNTYGTTISGYRLPLPADFVDGFCTALMNMHKGDHWRVTIPHQLAYGTTASGVIPAYSTLVFDIWLTDFWTKKKGDRY